MIVKKRNIRVVQGACKALHFKNESFHFVLTVVTICFISNPLGALFVTIKWMKILTLISVFRIILF